MKKSKLTSGDNAGMEEELISPDVKKEIEDKNEVPTGSATEDQISEWKKKHGRAFYLKGGGHICYVKKPSRKILSYASLTSTSKDGKVDNLRYLETVFLNIFLGGSEEFKHNQEMLLGVGPQILDLIEVTEVELGEL